MGLCRATCACLALPALLLVTSSVCAEEGPLVHTSYGWVQGGYTTTRGGRQITEFLGIPYAKPPVDKLRFKSPEQLEPWSGVRNATVECPICIQQFILIEALRNDVTGEEDCLCINVYTPDVLSAKKAPVMVMIHGGAYIGMTSEKKIYGPDLLLDKNVLLVTFSYRLGVLGLFSTEDPVIPGNFAMKDQLLALKWVKENIAQFGGDVNSITIMGESSGAANVHLHMLSPASQDFFHRGIIESGSGLCQWAVSVPGELKNRTATVAKLVGCPATPSEDLLECLQKRSAKELVATTNKFLEWDMDPVVFWKVTIEDSSVEDAFLTKDPWTLTSTKPLLAGMNYGEGAFKTLSVTSGNVEQKFKQWNDQFDELMPMSLIYDLTAPDPAAITQAIRPFYFGSTDKPITRDMYPQIDKLYGDFWFANGVMDAIEKHEGEKFMYYFNYNSTVSRCPLLYNNSIYLGACHMDELMYLFPMDNSYPKRDLKNPDYHMSLKMIEMWTNFATFSNPSTSEINWNPVKSEALEHLDITAEGIEMKTYPIKERRDFWKTLKLRE